MKTVNLTEEQYQHLVGLGIIKEEEQMYQSIGLRNDGTIVSEPINPIKPWEKYPTLKSCIDVDDDLYIIDQRQTGHIYPTRIAAYGYSTEAEARRARATIKLSRIAREWNEGVEKGEEIYFIADLGFNFIIDVWSSDGIVSKLLPFYFHSNELAEKSLELFEQDWKDFYNK